MNEPVTERNKEVIYRYYESLNERDFDAAADCYPEDYTATYAHPVTGEPEEFDLTDVRQNWVDYYEAFPDATLELHEVVAEDDRVMLRLTARGTHKGKFFEIDPTYENFEAEEYASYRLENEKIVESRGRIYLVDMIQQLGLELPFDIQ